MTSVSQSNHVTSLCCQSPFVTFIQIYHNQDHFFPCYINEVSTIDICSLGMFGMMTGWFSASGFPVLLFASIEILPQEVLQQNHLPTVFAFVCYCKSNIDRLCFKLILFDDRNTCSSGTWRLILIRKGFHETQRTLLYSSVGALLSSYYPLKRLVCYQCSEELQLDIQMEPQCDCYWFLSVYSMSYFFLKIDMKLK